MPIFEYKCSCGLRHEHLVLPPNQPPATHTCPRCKEAATKLAFPTSVALARSGMDNPPVDNFIGRDSERRWEDIHQRQATRDRVRQESGQVGLTMVGRNDFQPLTPEKKELRTSLNETIASSGGFQSADAVPGKSS